MVSLEYANAYTEVIEILKYIPRQDYEKISKERLELFYSNYNKEYKFKYNPELTLEEQGTSKLTKIIIAILFRDFWATDSQRDKIITKEKYDLQKKEDEKNDKYIYNNLFKQCEKIVEIEQPMSMIEYKQKGLFSKIINRIKAILEIK